MKHGTRSRINCQPNTGVYTGDINSLHALRVCRLDFATTLVRLTHENLRSRSVSSTRGLCANARRVVIDLRESVIISTNTRI